MISTAHLRPIFANFFDCHSSFTFGLREFFDCYNSLASNLRELFDYYNSLASNLRELFDYYNSLALNLREFFDIYSSLTLSLRGSFERGLRGGAPLQSDRIFCAIWPGAPEQLLRWDDLVRALALT